MVISYLSTEVLLGLTGLFREIWSVTCRAGACFQKSDETLLLERLHASRSAQADNGPKEAAPPAVSITSGEEGSTRAIVTTNTREGQSLAAAHADSAGNGCPQSQEALTPLTRSQQQQQQHGPQTCKESGRVSRCAGSSAQLRAETDAMQPREAVQCEKAKCAIRAGKLQRQDGAPESISFLDDVDCLDIE